MKIPVYSILLGFLTPPHKIKNLDKPVCKDCIYFKNEYFMNPNTGQCTKFGYKNIMSGEIFYEFAEICRNDENKCGVNGTYYKQHHGFFK
jgi:hypothetical protein